MKKLLTLAALSLLLTGCGAIAESEPTPSTFNFEGTLDLNQPMPLADEGQACFGHGGYEDIQPGTQAKILDASGTVIAIGKVGSGVATKTYEQLPGPNVCRFGVYVDNVPDGGDGIYGVEVGDRGVVNFEKAGGSATAQLTLG